MIAHNRIIPLLIAAVVVLAAADARAAAITFAEVSNGLTGSLIFADVSTNGTLLNAGTGDSTGVGTSGSGNTWGRIDTSTASGRSTPAGNTQALNLNVLEGFSAAPPLRWTFSSGSGDGTNGAGSLLPNTTYKIYAHFHTHTAASENWGVEIANNALFTGFNQMDNNDGVIITTVGTATTLWRRFEASFTVTTDALGNASLWIRRPTSGTHTRTYLDGVVLQLIPAPAALPAGLGLLGLASARRHRRPRR